MMRLAHVRSGGVLGCVLAIMLIASAAHAQNAARYGVVFNPDAVSAAKLGELGAGWIRKTVYWDQTEPSPKQWNLTSTYDTLNYARQYGVGVYLDLGQRTPSFYGPAPNKVPTDFNNWFDFVFTVMSAVRTNYPDVDVVFGVWNEPDLGSFLEDDGHATNWSSLFRVASNARNAISTSIRMAGPDYSACGAPGTNHYFYDAIQTILNWGQPTDVITLHYYPSHSEALWDLVNFAHTVSGNREVWLTETGASTYDGNVQAAALTPILDTFEANGSTLNWTKLFVYHLHIDVPDSHWPYSLIDQWDNNRPAFTLLKNRIEGQNPCNNLLMANQSLWANGSISSCNGQYSLVYQSDGNLVLYRSDGVATWASNTEGSSVGQAVMQGDGNLVIYNGSGQPIWDSGTWDSPGSYLVLGDDGCLRIRNIDDTEIWIRP